MEFLVCIHVRLPPDFDEERKRELIDAESERAKELAAQGVIRRLWRIPGRWANVGVWNAIDATSLHAAIASLPLFPWLEVEVTPLASHPSDPRGSGTEPSKRPAKQGGC
jgi:muconolactone D-isomerase